MSLLVDPQVTLRKFRAELEGWKADPEQTKRGWILLAEDYLVPSVQLALLGRVSSSFAFAFVPIVVCTILVTYENYDLWPPSIRFLDIFTREPSRPLTRAFLNTPEGPRDVLIDGHPDRGEPFLCLPGTREYHFHPQHTGDDWLLHRPSKEGSISVLCERLWRLMAKNIIGLNFSMQTLPVIPLQARVAVQVVQGNVETVQLSNPVNPETPQAQSEHQS